MPVLFASHIFVSSTSKDTCPVCDTPKQACPLRSAIASIRPETSLSCFGSWFHARCLSFFASLHGKMPVLFRFAHFCFKHIERCLSCLSTPKDACPVSPAIASIREKEACPVSVGASSMRRSYKPVLFGSWFHEKCLSCFAGYCQHSRGNRPVLFVLSCFASSVRF